METQFTVYNAKIESRALFFDLDGVVAMDTAGSLTTWGHVFNALKLGEKLGVDFKTFYQKTYGDEEGQRRFMHPLERGEVSDHLAILPEFTERIYRQFGERIEIDYFRDVVEGFHATKLNDPIVDLAARVSEATYAVGMITDNPADRMVNIMDKYPRLKKIFNPIVVSAAPNVRTLKKDINARQYDLAAREAGVEKAESWFIDNSKGNCEAAAKHGMNALLFDDTVLTDPLKNAEYVTQLEQELKRRGFDF